MADVSWQEARRAFPVLDRIAYLNAGTMGPLARATHEAVAEEQRLELEYGRGGPAYIERVQQLRADARERLAR